MPVTEESRHRLHRKLDQTIGEEDATTLMEHLPPVGWVDVATTQHLTQVEERLDAKIDHLRTETGSGFALVRRDITALDARMASGSEVLDARMASGFEVLDASVAKVGKDIADMGKRIDDSDRRYEALTARVDNFFWHVIALLGTIGVILVGVAQIRGR
jgi:hypothetical protein